MKVCFLSSRPCQLTLNGVYFGITDRFERSAEVCLSDGIFLCFTPENAMPISFRLTEDIRFTPPTGCEVYLLRDQIVIYAKDFPPSDFSLRIHAQKRFDNCLVTLFTQGKTQLTIESPNGFFNAYLPPISDDCELRQVNGCILVADKERLCLFSEDARLLLNEQILSFSIENDTLSARLPLNDSGCRYADCTWEIINGDCHQNSFSISDLHSAFPHEDLLVYAFFESVLLGLDYTQFLGDALLEKATDLPAFLGEFLSVIPQEDENACGLVYQKAERLYQIKIFPHMCFNGIIQALL